MGRNRVAILAIGTEVSDGQILDRNSAWLASRLVAQGFDVQEHRVVPDDRPLMRLAFQDLLLRSDLIFVTGGLGPTQDDFTRDIVAEIAQSPLQFNEVSWQEVNQKLASRGVTVTASQKQQCFFPKGASVLSNPAGTANAFSLLIGSVEVFVLPGPPTEVAAIWSETLERLLGQRVPADQKESLKIWRCLGKGEGELAERAAEALAGSGLRVGYRAHRPYVEVKVWAKEKEWINKKAWIEKLEQAVAPWLVNRDQEDFAEQILRLSQQNELEIWDYASGGILAERFAVAMRALRLEMDDLHLRMHSLWKTPRMSLSIPSAPVALHVQPQLENQVWIVSLGKAHAFESHEVKPAYNYTLASERGRQYIAEKALHLLVSWAKRQGLLS